MKLLLLLFFISSIFSIQDKETLAFVSENIQLKQKVKDLESKLQNQNTGFLSEMLSSYRQYVSDPSNRSIMESINKSAQQSTPQFKQNFANILDPKTISFIKNNFQSQISSPPIQNQIEKSFNTYESPEFRRFLSNYDNFIQTEKHDLAADTQILSMAGRLSGEFKQYASDLASAKPNSKGVIGVNGIEQDVNSGYIEDMRKKAAKAFGNNNYGDYDLNSLSSLLNSNKN